MKLGMIDRPYEDCFRSANEKGLDFLEFCVNHNADHEEFLGKVNQIKAWKKQYGVEIGSIGRWGSDRIDSEGRIIEQELDICCRLIDAAKELGCSNFVCGCNYIAEQSYYWNCTAAMRFLTRLIEYGRARGVCISTYNCRKNNFIHSSMAWTMIHGELKELGIKYDPSHARYAGEDYLKEAVEWGDRFYHVHLKGSLLVDGNRFDDPPAGMDQTDWKSFLCILYAKGYNGGLSIEPHSQNWKDELGDRGLEYTIQYMRKIMF